MKEPVRRHVTQKKREITNSKKFENHAMLENDYRFEIKLPLVSTLPTGSAYKVSAREQLISLRYDFFIFRRCGMLHRLISFFDSLSMTRSRCYVKIFSIGFFLWTVY